MNKKNKIYNGRYEKIAKIGEGAYGKVMMVQDLKYKPAPHPPKTNDLEENKTSNNDSSKIPAIFAIKKSKTEKHQNLQVFSKKML
jgi:hypothetical protein